MFEAPRTRYGVLGSGSLSPRIVAVSGSSISCHIRDQRSSQIGQLLAIVVAVQFTRKRTSRFDHEPTIANATAFPENAYTISCTRTSPSLASVGDASSGPKFSLIHGISV